MAQHHTSGRPYGDTTYTKIFVGGLAWETQKETMRRYFDQFGEIQEAVVIRDKATGRSKGYGFSYYGVCGGGHSQFSPYYGTGAIDLGMFHSMYPFYPQILQYPYLPQNIGGGILSTPASTSSNASVTPFTGASPSQLPGINPDQKSF